MPTATSRVVVEIHQGIDFPIGWADKPDAIDVGMARTLLVSVAAMLDADLNPIALCWCIDGRDEKFVHTRPGDTDEGSLLDELHRDLADESSRIGASDLLATMLWAPGDLRSDQGQIVRKIPFISGRFGSVRGWNIAPRTLVANAGNLLLMTRRADQGLAIPMPASSEEMHQSLGLSDANMLVVMPGGEASVDEKDIGRKMTLLFGGLVVLGALITAFLFDRA